MTGAGRRKLGVLVLMALLTGCAEQPLPAPPITPNDCLVDFQLDRLPEAIRRCNAVVAAFPQHPGPLNDRYLLHSLAGDNAAACRDLAAASRLAQRQPAGRVDPLLRQELRLRQQSCQP